MDFFTAQDHARRTSRLLLMWFGLAVFAMVMLVYIAVSLTLEGATAGRPAPVSELKLFLGCAAFVVGVILVGSLYKTTMLARGGGAAVAAEVGGRLVARATQDTLERRLVNVVDEMAIASGIPAPPVYVLDNEPGINAFAAGARPQEAVIAVTRGTLELLTRDELQGVIAHEFSHVLNGDMRLNLRLIGLLHGILMIGLAGRLLLHGGSRRSRSGYRRSNRNDSNDRDGNPVFMIGGALLIAGYVGAFFGKLLKAAVSRQREFLADASAVQFTRNPDGIAGALRRILVNHSILQDPRSEEVSHMLFSPGASFARWFSTHPPLDARLQRLERQGAQRVFIDPNAPRMRVAEAAAPAGETPRGGVGGGGPMASSTPAGEFAASVGTLAPAQVEAAHQFLDSLPSALLDSLHTPSGATAATLALFLASDAETRTRQLAAAAERFKSSDTLATTLIDDTQRQYTAIQTLRAHQRLPLIELATASLRELSVPLRSDLLGAIGQLVAADGRVTLTEYVLQRILQTTLMPIKAGRTAATPGELRQHCGLLLTVLAHAGQRAPDQIAAAFTRGAKLAPVDGAEFVPVQTIRYPALDTALASLAGTASGFRRKLVEALAAVALHDQRIVAAEAELLHALCSSLDCPVPLTQPVEAA